MKQFGLLIVHNPGPDTKIELVGMEGDEGNKNFESGAEAVTELEERLKAGGLGKILVMHENNQLCLWDTRQELLDEGLIEAEGS